MGLVRFIHTHIHTLTRTYIRMQRPTTIRHIPTTYLMRILTPASDLALAITAIPITVVILIAAMVTAIGAAMAMVVATEAVMVTVIGAAMATEAVMAIGVATPAALTVLQRVEVLLAVEALEAAVDS